MSEDNDPTTTQAMIDADIEERNRQAREYARRFPVAARVETPLERHRRLQRETEVAVVVEPRPTLSWDQLHPKTRKILEECTRTGEPFIVFRGKDLFTPMVIAYYLSLIEKVLPSNGEQQMMLVEHQQEIVSWQRQHPDRVRYPD